MNVQMVEEQLDLGSLRGEIAANVDCADFDACHFSSGTMCFDYHVPTGCFEDSMRMSQVYVCEMRRGVER